MATSLSQLGNYFCVPTNQTKLNLFVKSTVSILMLHDCCAFYSKLTFNYRSGVAIDQNFKSIYTCKMYATHGPNYNGEQQLRVSKGDVDVCISISTLLSLTQYTITIWAVAKSNIKHLGFYGKTPVSKIITKACKSMKKKLTLRTFFRILISVEIRVALFALFFKMVTLDYVVYSSSKCPTRWKAKIRVNASSYW